jgi:uncharacterized protein YhfF
MRAVVAKRRASWFLANRRAKRLLKDFVFGAKNTTTLGRSVSSCRGHVVDLGGLDFLINNNHQPVRRIRQGKIGKNPFNEVGEPGRSPKAANILTNS